MRDDIVALKNLLDGLDVGYSIDYQSTNRYANDISTSLSANRQKYGNSLSKWGYGASQQSTYQDFYKNCSSSLSYINELVKIGNSTSNKSANTINQARQAYDNAVVLFNSFVQ
jgi:hypothetical protein